MPEDQAIENFDKGATLGMGAFGRVFLVRYKKSGEHDQPPLPPDQDPTGVASRRSKMSMTKSPRL